MHVTLFRRLVAALVCAASIAFVWASAVQADLEVNPPGFRSVTFNGRGGYSADALGQATEGGTVQAKVPEGSTVVQAYLYAATNGNLTSTLVIQVDATPVPLGRLFHNNRTNEASYRADITELVSPKVESGDSYPCDLPDLTPCFDFTIGNTYSYLNGVALVVIYENSEEAEEAEFTIYVLDGGLSSGIQTVNIFYPTPIDPTLPDFSATLSLGISLAQQEVPGSHECAGSQRVFVDVNGNRTSDLTRALTSCAGGADDGTGDTTSNETVVTVGGVGDETDNPDPLLPVGADDELYDITSYLTRDGGKCVAADCSDPDQLLLRFVTSGNDHVFLAIVKIRTAPGTEGPYGSSSCGDGADNDGDGLIDGDDPDCAPPPEVCDDGIDNDGDGLTDTFDPDCALKGRGKMTGGAAVVANPATGFEVKFTLHLRCDLAIKGEDKLDVRWETTTTDAKGKPKKQENKFTLDMMNSAFCVNSPFLFPKKRTPINLFDTQDGSGTGTINGVTSADITWQFADGGEPNGQDFARIFIEDSDGNVAVAFEGPLKSGNIQAHEK